jgi:hypothetical protein
LYYWDFVLLILFMVGDLCCIRFTFCGAGLEIMGTSWPAYFRHYYV